MSLPENKSTATLPPQRQFRRGLAFSMVRLMAGAVLIAGSLLGLVFLSEFRVSWLQERLIKANIATSALSSAPSRQAAQTLALDIFRNTEILAVMAESEGALYRVFARRDLPPVGRRINIDEAGFWQNLGASLVVLYPRQQARILRVEGMLTQAGGQRIGIILDETYLREAMLGFALRMMGLILASAAGAVLILWPGLNRVILRPLRRLAGNMRDFQEKPEDKSRILLAGRRSDEIGEAEQRLAAMEREIHSTLRQKQRAAALGEAVQKINHDLRNSLASAQLLSDQIAASSDGAVRQLAPRLVSSLDRAIALCTHTLEYGRAETDKIKPEKINLRHLVEQVTGELAPLMGEGVIFANEVPPEISLWADSSDIFRILANLGRNAGQAILDGGEKGRIRISASMDGSLAQIRLEDNGPGLPPRALEHLWRPFAGRSGGEGFGLGLPIARELARAQGGDLKLVETNGEGTRFTLTLPLYQEQTQTGRVIHLAGRKSS